MNRDEIQIRDPFILTVEKEGKYYLYGTTDKNCWGSTATGFNAYESTDLEKWEGPFEVFKPQENFWADRNFWAPEVYYYNGRYFMFASFKSEECHRGTQVLSADSPKGPFEPIADKPITPFEWECLDGTLYIDEKENPWIVFCREWVQVADGEVYAMPLSKDLMKAIGEPVLLFRASEAGWVHGGKRKFIENGQEVEKDIYVTDGPFIYRTKTNELLMLWSSHGANGYAMGIVRSKSGNVLGPWKHEDNLLYEQNGGHGMIFRAFDGQLMFTIHCPNKTPNERPVFIKIKEVNGELVSDND